MTFLAKTGLYFGFAAACLAVVLGLVFLETNTDVVSDIRVHIGTQDGRISQNSLPFDREGTLVDRVANWRAYSGANRHLPAPHHGWRRNEIPVSPEMMAAFRAKNRPELVATHSEHDFGLLRTDAVIETEELGPLDVNTAGIVGGAAHYTNGEYEFVAVLQRVPPAMSELLYPYRKDKSEVELAREGIIETSIAGRAFRYRANGVGDAAYITLTSVIGRTYLLTVEGDAPLPELAAHLGRMDFYRLEKDSFREEDNSIESLEIIGDALINANGFDLGQD